jgi:hypothetical protein
VIKAPNHNSVLALLFVAAVIFIKWKEQVSRQCARFNTRTSAAVRRRKAGISIAAAPEHGLQVSNHLRFLAPNGCTICFHSADRTFNSIL